MSTNESPLRAFPELRATADYIARLQRPNGAIPWFKGGITDPWDHTEAMMGLVPSSGTEPPEGGVGKNE